MTDRLISSGLAVEAVVALEQRPGGMRLSDLAAVLGVAVSSAQRALELLTTDSYVERPQRGVYRRRVDHPATEALATLARRVVAPSRAIELMMRASEAVEFAGEDRKGYLFVPSIFATPSDEARLERALSHVIEDRSDAPSVAKVIRVEARGNRSLRRRAEKMRVVRGDVARSFPVRTRRRAGRRLGRLHGSIATPSRRSVANLVRRHHLTRIVVFGSAVRSDFRRDSDVDVLVEPAGGHRLGLDEFLDLKRELEEMFGRDADVVNASFARPALRRAAYLEGVALHG